MGQTLVDLFELRGDSDDVELDEDSWEACSIVEERAPLGVGHEAWQRARGWCADEARTKA